MDMGRSPGVGVIEPGIGSRANGQEAIHTLRIGQTTPHTQKIGIKWPWPLIAFMQVASCCIGLPDLQQCMGYWIPKFIQDAPGHNDALADSLTTGSGIAREISILRGDGTDGRSRAGQFREGQRHLDEWE